MAALTARDLRGTLETLQSIADACADVASFARAGVGMLPALAASELTTLSICDLDTAHRSVVSEPSGAISSREIEVFDRHFFAHPLVRHHGRNAAARTRQIADLVPRHAFRETALYNDYYRAIGVDEAVAVPLYVDGRYLVSFVLQRKGRPFADTELACLELARPILASLYRLAAALDDARPASASAGGAPQTPTAALTPREREVLGWVAAGKTNADIADILDASPRTVAKHLEHIYEKLGVETRTAAAMRYRG
jgi:DNA-binding CsgD family transcriptional regulator